MFSTELTQRRIVKLLAFLLALNLFASPVQSKIDENKDTNLPVDTSPEVSLTSLRDLGLIIQQIEQQAINIYMEATRKPLKVSAKAKIQDLKFIKNSNINTKTKYLKPRPEWLTFYVGTMEPIIHLFTVSARMNEKNVDYILVPKSIEAEFKKLLEEYNESVDELNKDVTTIFDNISTKNNNVTVAKATVNLYKTAKSLEKARRTAFKLIKHAKDKNNLVKIWPKAKTN